MAVDEAVFRARADGQAPPTLRLYRWHPPAVSLGRFQELDERIDREAIAARGYGLVRRPTGGRAILHSAELTYSVVVRETDIAGGQALMTSYQVLSQGIEAGLGLLGLQARMGPEGDRRGDRAQSLPTICFAKAARCDLVAAGRKVVGSAQTRARGTILQHGSIPLTIDLDELLAVLPGKQGEGLAERRAKLSRAACGVSELLGRSVSAEEVSAALALGFQTSLGVELREGVLAPEEEALAEELEATRYGKAEWTERAPSRQATEARPRKRDIL